MSGVADAQKDRELQIKWKGRTVSGRCHFISVLYVSTVWLAIESTVLVRN